jgi:2-methylisocitrate lyase-like PEP mutase family enzyme
LISRQCLLTFISQRTVQHPVPAVDELRQENTTMNAQRPELAQKFLELHRHDGCFIVPNAWDIGSAKMLEAAGYSAIATTSAGIAFSLGRVDHGYAPASERVDRDTMLERVRAMASELRVPLSADLEAGYGISPDAVAETIGKALDAGASGGNIEDFTGQKDRPLFELPLAVERIKAAREAIDRRDAAFVLVGRTDSLLANPGSIEECVRRGNAYREAGADCIFVPGASSPETIDTLVREIDAPINVVMGLSGNRLTLAELKELGVRRVTIGGSLARAVFHHIRRAAMEMLEQGTFTFADEQVAHAELNQIFEGAERPRAR